MPRTDEPQNKHTAAQLAAAAAQIAAGALRGGLHGAAVEGAKLLLPRVAAIVAGAFFLIIVVPFLAFYCLPNSYYGVPSVELADVQNMTQQAQQAGEYYASTQRCIESCAREMAAQAGEGYDDVVPTYMLHGIDSYWIAAISSVQSMQDPSLIQQSTIQSLAAQSLQQTSAVETYTEEIEVPHYDADGELLYIETKTVERKRLHIDISCITAEQLMTRLGFTEEQKAWARQIHSVIADSQLQEEEGGSVGDLGDVVFSDAARNVVYYNQQDARWSGLPYAGSTIGVAGCGPTSMAIVISTLTGTAVTPSEVASWAEQAGYACYGNGSYHALIPGAAQHYGLYVEAVGVSSAQQLADALAAGKLVVAIMGRGHFTTSGHFIVLRGVTAEGEVLVADPYTYSFCNRPWSISLILNEAKRGAGAGGPFWIISS